MKFRINSKIFELYPELTIGVIVARDINNADYNSEINNLLSEQTENVKNNYTHEKLAEDPKITAWRTAYSKFGAKPKKYKCSVENLYRMILDGIELHQINNLVDLYNYISLKHLIPVGGDDIDCIDGGIELTVANGDEQFIQLNATEATSPKPGEVIYRDDKEVLCRRWNWRECDKSKMTQQTKNAILAVEGLPPVEADTIKTIISELQQLIKKFCGGQAAQYILDKSNSEIRFD